jgi:hypothetical protein
MMAASFSTPAWDQQPPQNRFNLPSGPLSNRACRSPAHGFPTPFIAVHTPTQIEPFQQVGKFRDG